MPPIEVGPLRAVNAIESALARRTSESAKPSPRTEKAEPAIIQSDVLNAGDMPVDADRVQLIRKAIEQGTYPVVPARVADAVIAAGLLLRSGQ